MSLEFIVEPAKKTRVLDNVDVLVVGGGPSGIMAAQAAAEDGLSVIIIERLRVELLISRLNMVLNLLKSMFRS